jgi:three-Cys-motif partner protein
MNQFGGNWTDKKMDIVVSYAKAYLTIMSKQKWAKTIYFDGFAGSGTIEQNVNADSIPQNNLFVDQLSLPTETLKPEKPKKGTALRILDIIDPKPFDMYYFVEKDEANYKALLTQIEKDYPGRKPHVVLGDCNKKLVDLASFLNKKGNENYRVLAFIDPYGMSVNWTSIEALKNLGVDLWILVPTGVGANRLLVNDGNIPESWLKTLKTFLGIDSNQIKSEFYKQYDHSNSLFGELSSFQETVKEKDTVNKIGKLYSKKLKEAFKYVSEPFILRNSMNSIMYHFMMATNNPSALKIANEVIKPKYKL